MREGKVTPPAADVLERQMLERMITERSLMQFAKETGVRIDDTAVERAILRIAQDNKISPDELRKVLEREGISYAKYREDIRRELIDAAPARARSRGTRQHYRCGSRQLSRLGGRPGRCASICCRTSSSRCPSRRRPTQIEQRRLRAESAWQQVRSGNDFAQVAASMSDAPDALQGASLGWRTAARLPTAFADLVRKMSKGDVTPVLRSPAGFHIVKLVDQRDRGAPTVVDQTRVRHILVRVNETTSEAEARTRIDRVLDRLDTGAKFEDMARINSEDASSAKGGDLGWVNPGDTVPEFEQAMDKLAVGETSRAVRTPFGWHLMKVEERRKQDITQNRRREQARQSLRQRKADELFSEFVRQTRDRAYVELKVDER